MLVDDALEDEGGANLGQRPLRSGWRWREQSVRRQHEGRGTQRNAPETLEASDFLRVDALGAAERSRDFR
jgi:hypothetical protein